MDLANKINRGIANGDPEYTFIMSVIIGILFSGVSFGLFYVILSIFIWEFLYYCYLDAKYLKYQTIDRILFALGSIMGFLIGRAMHSDDDHYTEYQKFKKDYHHYGREFGWFDTNRKK